VFSDQSPANNDVHAIAKAVIADLKNSGKTGRIISSWNSSIQEDEYRIALRCGANDYHFMRQNNDGTWAEKPGRFLQVKKHKTGNPSTLSWNKYTAPLGIFYTEGYYNSKIIYIAVGKR